MKYSYAKETTDAVYLTVISHSKSRASQAYNEISNINQVCL